MNDFCLKKLNKYILVCFLWCLGVIVYLFSFISEEGISVEVGFFFYFFYDYFYLIF